MVKFGVGQSVRRVEDVRLLTGTGRYTDDVSAPRQTHAYFLRSPHAHAELRALDTAAAKDAPGVLGVFTGADLRAAGIGDLPCIAPIPNRDRSAMTIPPRPALAVDRVRFVGEPVAVVVAETLAQARDAGELIEATYAPLPASVDTAATLEPGAPQIWDFAKSNRALDWALGDEAKTKAAFAGAHRVVEVDLVNNRLAPTSMEPRQALGEYTAATDRLTLNVACQGVNIMRSVLAGPVFHVPDSKIRVVSGDVGGGFGMKIFLYPEYVGVLFAARAVGRPVKWTGDRSEAFLSDTHGRDHRTRVRLALDKDGQFLGLHVATTANLGAYLSQFAPYIPTLAGSRMLASVYRFPAVFVEVTAVYTNTAPVDAYRGAGRPEANYTVERVVDAASRATGIPPDELRRRNFIPAEAMPYKTALDSTYDSGKFVKNMGDALKAADWAGFATRREEARKRGKRRGIGLAYYIEACGGGADETAQIRVASDGAVTLLIGSQSNGQGHETMYAQLIAERLGVPFESVRVVQGDTDVVIYPGMTGGSKATAVGGTATLNAADRVIAKGKTIAAHALETAEIDIEFTDGEFRVAGTDRKKTFADIVKLAHAPAGLPPGLSPGLDETASTAPLEFTYPNGCHICEIEIDPETGVPEIVRYTIVDDFGRVINPMLLAGQVHGGAGQGLGQALYENCVYDPATGQLLSGSFMDYGMPRADNTPSFDFSYHEEAPCQANPLGVKGAGEAGAMGAPPATIHAVIDALKEYGVDGIDMPATPEKIWRAIHKKSPRKAA